MIRLRLVIIVWALGLFTPVWCSPAELRLEAARLNNSGVEKMNKCDYVAAIEDFTQAINLREGRYTIAYLNRGIARQRHGDWKGALADFVEANHIEPQNLMAIGNRASAEKHLGMYKESLEHYSDLIEMSPSGVVADVFKSRAEVRQALGDISGARADWKQFESLKRKQSKSKRKTAH